MCQKQYQETYENKENRKKCLKECWVVGISVTVFLIVETVSILRSVFLWLKLEMESQSLDDDNSTSSGDLRGEKNRRDIAMYLYVFLVTLHVFEYLCLAVGVWESKETLQKWDEDFWRELLQEARKELKKSWVLTFVVIVSFLGFAAIALAQPSLEITYGYDNVSVLVFHILTIIAHLITVKVRIAFMCVVFAIKLIWFNKIEAIAKECEIPVSLANERDITPDARNAARIYFKYYRRYEQRAERVKTLLCIFDEWFVVQWAHYLFVALLEFWDVLLPLLRGETQPESTVQYAFLYVRATYLCFAFIIPYLCGAKAHRLHKSYYRHLMGKMNKEAAGILSDTSNAKRIKDNERGDRTVVVFKNLDTQENGYETPMVEIPSSQQSRDMPIQMTVFPGNGSAVEERGVVQSTAFATIEDNDDVRNLAVQQNEDVPVTAVEGPSLQQNGDVPVQTTGSTSSGSGVEEHGGVQTSTFEKSSDTEESGDVIENLATQQNGDVHIPMEETPNLQQNGVVPIQIIVKERGVAQTAVTSDTEGSENVKKETSMIQIAFINRTPLAKSEKCGFVPRVRMIGLNIPMSNPGYAFGVLFVMVALIGKIFLA